MIAYITSHWKEIVDIIVAVVIAARVIVKITPTPADDTFLDKVIEWCKHLGLHIDSVKIAEEKEVATEKKEINSK